MPNLCSCCTVVNGSSRARAVTSDASLKRIVIGRPTALPERQASQGNVVRIATLLLAGLASLPCMAAPMSGLWEARFPCPRPQSEECRRGSPESFALRLRVEGKQLCGVHSSVAQFGNRIDEPDGNEPSLAGRQQGDEATVHFTSAFGATGTATLRLVRGRLHWSVESQSEGESWLPTAAVLHRVPESSWRSNLRCAGQASPTQ